MKESAAKPANSFRPGVIALAVALGYVVLCGLYIDWSTSLAARWAGSVHQLAVYEIAKGLTFVAVTGILFYLVTFLLLKRLAAQEERLRHNEATLVAADRKAMAGVFAGSVAHDIGNTLTVADSAISWLQEPSMSTEERAAAVSDLKRASQELAQLSRRLMLLHGTRTPFPPHSVALAPVIKESVRFAQSHSKVRNCRFTYALDETARATVVPLTVGRIMLNLILNAADATDGRGKIHIRLWPSDGEVHLEVHDNGPGIPPDLRERVFEPLYTSKPDGTGLGLVSVKTAVEDELRGEISVIDSPFGGACFRISLPR
ncbi:MAG TPA: HAMP domain-containing sensor histidine kinase [Gemmatimonadales bacterium]|nr:HAMP domain-containing sensor histidine kinase [Gemmatimonadales bacterium]